MPQFFRINRLSNPIDKIINKKILLTISVAGGILTGLAWTTWCSGLILLISFVPFLFIENYLYENKSNLHGNSVFVFLFPGFLIANIIALGWVYVASIIAAVFLIIVSAFCMTFVIWLAHIVRLKAGDFSGVLALIAFWLSLEFLNLSIDPLNPWLNLGNGLAKDIQFIQWYDTTGTAGGTFWILLSNILTIVLIIRMKRNLSGKYLYPLLLLSILVIPIFVSFIKFKQYTECRNYETEVLIIQPNIDPYSEKFNRPFIEQLETVMKMAESGITDNTKWIIAPETTIDDPINESDIQSNKYIVRIQKLLDSHPAASMIIGATSFTTFDTSLLKTSSSMKKMEKPDLYYELFNSALKIDTGKQVNIYHKSKLVLGVETKFNGFYGKIINRLLPQLGGTQSGYGTQSERTIFEHNGNNQKVASIICYESVFGEFVTQYVRNGAELLFIITNDGWWKNTKGYKQHLFLASLRAIETRRSIARAANTGISCFIDKRGIILSLSNWCEPAILKGSICTGVSVTPYVRYGDYIFRTGNIISIFILILAFVAIPLQKRFKLGK
jgi:apolipoprotein N-acyltransferase